jgi:hypothetical protein
LAGKSITPRGSRTSRPSTVARFNSVSVIASGSVKLLFSSVITDCRSAGPNELIKASVVGVADGETAGGAGDFDGACGVLPPGGGGAVGAGDCAARFAASMEIATEQSSNRDITMICRC